MAAELQGQLLTMGTMFLEPLLDWKPWQLCYRNNCQTGNHGNCYRDNCQTGNHSDSVIGTTVRLVTMLLEQLSDWKTC